jgi:uncharacterized protein YbjT (DUF2867 family)
MRQAIVIGATGLVGEAVTRQLAALKHPVPVRILVRHFVLDLPASVEQAVLPRLDLTEELEAYLTPDAWVFCCVGTTMRKAGSSEAFRAVDIDIPVAVAQAAKATGAAGLTVVSSVGANENGFFFYTRTKGEMELAVQASGLKALHIMRPGLLLGKRKEIRFGELLSVALSKLLMPLFIGPLAKYRPIRADVLAKVMIDKAQKGVQGMLVLEGEKFYSR